jgi:hypothetical protein
MLQEFNRTVNYSGLQNTHLIFSKPGALVKKEEKYRHRGNVLNFQDLF